MAPQPVVNYGVTYPVNSLLAVRRDGTTSGHREMACDGMYAFYASTSGRLRVHLMTKLIVVYGIVDVMRISHQGAV